MSTWTAVFVNMVSSDGMPTEGKFNIVKVVPSKGGGIDAVKNFDTTVKRNGKNVVLNL